jgi:glyoxylase-like metal-dependent hydrolase (beta-lactamase superfamily II)
VQVVQETKSLFRLTRFGMVNCLLAREDDGFTLIDTGVAGSAAGIREAAQRMGVPICRIVLTHAHLDHVGSLDAVAREYP